MIKFSPKKWLVFLLASIQFLLLSDYLLVMPIGPNLMQNLLISTSQFAALISVYSIGAITVALTTAGFLDRFDRMLELRIAFLIFLAVSGLHIFASSYTTLLLLRFLAGGLAGLCGSLLMSVLSHSFGSNQRGRAIGMVLSATSVAQIIGIPVGLFLVNKFSWNTPFLLNCCLGIPILILLFRVKPEPDSTKNQDTTPGTTSVGALRQMLDIARQPFHFKAILCTLLTMSAGTLIIPFLPLLLVYRYHVPETQLGPVYLFAGILAFVASLVAGKLSGTGSGKLAIFTIFPLGILPLLTFTFVPSMPVIAAVAVFTVCNTLLVIRMIPINRFILEYVHPDYMGGFQSINTALLHIGASSAAAIGGFFISAKDGQLTGFGNAAFLSISILAVLLLLIQFGFRKT